jgi:predicted enzyme related to lactoylglutathione lyase
MGGLMTLPGEAKAGGTPPCWMSYIGTANTDETVRKAVALGGKIHKAPWTIADGGRIAILGDPQGAIFCIYANLKAADTPTAHALGHASWHELATSDFAGAFSFYQTLFGWHVVDDMDMGPGMGIYRLFAAEGSNEQLGGMYTKPAQQPGPPAWLPYIKVANIKAATDKARSLGATIMHGPAEVPGGWITMGADPQGAMFAVHSTQPAAKAAAKKPKPVTKKAAPKTKSKAATKKKPASPKRKPKARAKAGKPKARAKAGSKK